MTRKTITPTRSAFGLTAILLAMIALFTVSLSVIAPPAPDPDHAFDTQRAVGTLARILGDERPHPVDTNANDAVRERLLSEIRSLGFDPVVRDDFRCSDRSGGVCARVQNVLFWAVPPTDETTQGVALMSHYDSVPAGPGAGDDGAGVAIGLEIARLLKGREDLRPVLVLITDGEEIGLLGAESFVYTDPLAARIDAVVNVEARGVRGPISMFQTSRPNGRDIAAIAKSGRTALANTLSSDIYDAMPNDTDVSRFLDADAPRTVDATNYAFILGDSFYHTPGDNLANLDKGTLFHSGINALASVERFAAGDVSDTPEGRRIYFDVLTRAVVSVPAWMGIGTILLSGLLAIAGLARSRTWRGWRGWAILPLALIVAVLGTLAVSAILGALKTSGAYSPAHPWALRGATSAIAVLVAVTIATGLRERDRCGAILKSWLWLSLLGAMGWLLFPGSVVIVFAALFIASFAMIAALMNRETITLWLSGLAAVVFILVNLPMTGFALAALGGMAAPFAALWAIPAVIMVLVLAGEKNWLPRVAMTAATLTLIITALIVPTYTAKAPSALTVRHLGTDAGNVVQISSRAAPPDVMVAGGAPFTMRSPDAALIPTYAYPRWTRDIAAAPDIDADIALLSDTVTDGQRQIEIEITAPTANRIHLGQASAEAAWTALSINGTELMPRRWGVRVTGREARSLRARITLPEDQPLGQIAIMRFGLGADTAPLAAARPDWTLPRQDGDVRVRLIDIDAAIAP